MLASNEYINLWQRATLLSVESLREQFLFLCEIYLSTHCEMLAIKPVQALSTLVSLSVFVLKKQVNDTVP